MNTEELQAKIAHLESIVLLLAKAHSATTRRFDTTLALLEQTALRSSDRLTGLAHELAILRESESGLDILGLLEKNREN